MEESDIGSLGGDSVDETRDQPITVDRIRSWLRPTSYDDDNGEYRKHLASLQPGTGAWLTASPEYHAWLNGSDQGLLWVQGVPGSGKSVLAAKLVHEISLSGVPVLYFFFRQIIDANQTPDALLRDWLDQILPHSDPLQKRLQKEVRRGTNLDNLGTEGLWKLLRQALGSLQGRAYCIVDALDEMNKGNSQFLRELSSLGCFHPSKVRVLVTSRPVADVTNTLRAMPTSQIRLDADIVDRDISTFVRNSLAASELSPEDQDRIHQAIPGHANGLFLYAKLALDAFLEPGANLEVVIEHLPTDLNAIYTNLLEAHLRRASVEPAVQRLVLKAATHATRPLRLLEMAALLRTACASLAPHTIGSVKDMIRAACGPLLEILPSETVSVIHHSFTEYLKGDTRSRGDGGYPILDATTTQLELARVCVEYLGTALDDAEEHQDLRQNTSGKRDIAFQVAALSLKYPFIEYAAKNWAIHASRLSLPAQRCLNDSIHALFQKPLFRSKGVQLWLLHAKYHEKPKSGRGSMHSSFSEEVDWSEEGYGQPILDQLSHLHLAARMGLSAYVEWLVSNGGVPINIGDKNDRTALCWAAEYGQAEVVRVLLSTGADPDTSDSYHGYRPLHHAALRNHTEVAKALLEAGVSPLTKKTKEEPGRRCGNAPRTVGQTPWLDVCVHGHMETFEVLLPYVKDSEWLGLGLHWAASRGREAIVTRLLQHPDIDRTPKALGNLLFRACEQRHLGIVKLLLTAGADSNTCSFVHTREIGYWSDMPKYSCLEALCINRYPTEDDSKKGSEVEIMSLLVKYGADVCVRTTKGNSALHYAAGSPSLVRELLDLGLDANQVNDDGNTPLHLAQSPDTVTLLVEKGGADHELRNTAHGRTPLLELLANPRGRGYAAQKLLEYKPDCKATDNSGCSPLHHAMSAFSPNIDTIQLLLELGADPNLLNAGGLRPLDLLKDYMRPEQVTRIVSLFQKAGLDLDAKDSNGRSQLFRLFQKEKKPDNSQIQQLLDLGASLDTRDAKGRTLLHEALTAMRDKSERNGFDPFRNLLERGLDPHAVDNDGNTLLHEFSARVASKNPGFMSRHVSGATSAWGVLVGELGLDVNQANFSGKTPLHVLSATSDFDNHYAKLGPGALEILTSSSNIDVPDAHGLTPLHLAAVRSQPFTKLLLENGANPDVKTDQQLTPLHLAVRAGNADSVGMLLDALARDVGRTSTLVPGFWYFDASFTVPGVDDQDERGWTPLSYACRAGRTDLVDILLKAGADPTHRVHLEACGQFEDEMALWAVANTTGETSQPVEPFGLRVEDDSRWRTDNWSISNLFPFRNQSVSRIDDIVALLLEAGNGDVQQRLDLGYIAMRLGTATGKEYTRACFNQAVLNSVSAGFELGVPSDTLESMRLFNDEYWEGLRVSIIGGPGGTTQIYPGKRYWSLFDNIMQKRAYELVLDLSGAGVELCARDPDHEKKPSAVSYLLQHGFAALAKRILPAETQAPRKKRQRTATDEEIKEQTDDPSPEVTGALLMSSSASSMQVLRMLVEDVGADLTKLPEDHVMDPFMGNLPGPTTVLHHLANGKSWWHVALALPYLIRRGADVNLRDSKGNTPLHYAVRQGRTQFHLEAVRLLIQAGADGFATPAQQPDLLAAAIQNPVLVRIVAQEAGEPSADLVIALIHHQLPDDLEGLLQRWPSDVLNTLGQLPTEQDKKGPSWYPLHYALVTERSRWFSTETSDQKQSGMENTSRIIGILLGRGADPFAVYPTADESTAQSSVKKTYSGRFSNCRESRGTLLHQAVLRRSRFLHRVLGRDNLDIDRRDDEGRTILHMACIQEPDLPIADSRELQADADTEDSPTTLSPIQVILARGADPFARDGAGRNALHHIFHGFTENDMHGPRECRGGHLKSATFLASNYPELVNQRNGKGQTPLLLAMHRAVSERAATPAVKILLSAGADPCVADEEGNGILHIAAQGLDLSEVFEIFQRLLNEYPLDINAKNARGQAPLFLYTRGESTTPRLRGEDSAVAERYLNPRERVQAVAILQMFDEAGAGFDTRDAEGRGLLHAAAYATEAGGVEKFKTLRARGLDPFLEDAESRTPLDIAASCSNEEVVAMFER